MHSHFKCKSGVSSFFLPYSPSGNKFLSLSFHFILKSQLNTWESQFLYKIVHVENKSVKGHIIIILLTPMDLEFCTTIQTFKP